MAAYARALLQWESRTLTADAAVALFTQWRAHVATLPVALPVDPRCALNILFSVWFALHYKLDEFEDECHPEVEGVRMDLFRAIRRVAQYPRYSRYYEGASPEEPPGLAEWRELTELHEQLFNELCAKFKVYREEALRRACEKKNEADADEEDTGTEALLLHYALRSTRGRRERPFDLLPRFLGQPVRWAPVLHGFILGLPLHACPDHAGRRIVEAVLRLREPDDTAEASREAARKLLQCLCFGVQGARKALREDITNPYVRDEAQSLTEAEDELDELLVTWGGATSAQH